MQAFFKSMSEIETSTKATLKRSAFHQFLQDRYSSAIGDNILHFLEFEFDPMYGLEYSDFLRVIVDFLNKGFDCYKKMLFYALSLSNPGRICEHDIFTVFEKFK